MKLGTICNFGLKSKIKAGESAENGKYMFFTSSSDTSKRVLTYQYDSEGIIMGTGGNATLHYYSGKFSISTDCLVLFPIPTVNTKYLYYTLLSKMNILQQGFKGAGLKHTSKQYISDIDLSFIHDLSIQNDIVDILSKIETIIEFKKNQLTLLDELIKSRFIELFGNPEHNEKQWNVFKLDELCSVSSSKRIYQNELSMEGVPFLRISDLVNRMDTGSTECDLYIPEERYEELKILGLVPVAGDMLITARGTLGRCYTLTESDRFYFQDGMITWLYDFDKALTTNYLTHLFAMSGFRKQIDSLQAGSTVAYLSISMTKKLDVMLPPLELQNLFIAFLEQIDKSKFEIQKSLEETQKLFDSLMQEYFG